MENPVLVELLTILFSGIIGTFWFFCFLEGLSGDSKIARDIKIPDRFDIGYIDDNPTPVQQVVVVQEPAKPKKKKKKQQAPVEPIPFDSVNETVKMECIGALVSLGHSRSEARRIFASVDNKHVVESAEQFINKVMSGEWR